MFPFRIIARLSFSLLVLVGQNALAGNGLYWQGPTFALPLVKPDVCRDFADAEQLYANAREYDHQDSATCVDQYFEAAVLTARRECVDQRSERTRHVHESSVQKLVLCGHQFGRLNLNRGLTVIRGGVKHVIPITYRGFIWRTDQFDLLTPVGEYFTDELSTNYRCPGVGVPMVATSRRRTNDNYRSKVSAFAATLRLNVDSPAGIRLELYDPLRVETTMVGQTPCPIHKDLSAIYAYRLRTTPREDLARFINPYLISADLETDQGQLYTLEPYQRGKTPIIMIHGLLSDPFTWAEMVNELRVQPEFNERFQIWLFEYPTGRPFLGSAAELRSQIEGACRKFDPQGSDPALSNIILFGHSMGGLIAKMQITNSGDRVWRAAANRPFDQVIMCDDLRAQLTRTFFFKPSRRITRVVYLATPHRGSALSTRLIGRFASTLVREPNEIRQKHNDLVRDNPGVFSRQVTRRVPTSIDLLEPKSKLLQEIDQLPVRNGVSIHSIIGDKCLSVTLSRSDGVVPVENARDRRSITERFVKATHGDVKNNEDTIEEILSILDLHVNQSHQCQISTIPIETEVEANQFQRAWVTSTSLH
jgi:pimeloyl-ACP methyl ester carboxylesterase